MKGPTILWVPNGSTRPTSKPPRSRRRWSIICCSMAEEPRVDAEHQRSKILAVIGKLEPAVGPVAPDQLDAPTRLGRQPQARLPGDIPQRGRQPVFFCLVGSPNTDHHAPV